MININSMKSNYNGRLCNILYHYASFTELGRFDCLDRFIFRSARKNAEIHLGILSYLLRVNITDYRSGKIIRGIMLFEKFDSFFSCKGLNVAHMPDDRLAVRMCPEGN